MHSAANKPAHPSSAPTNRRPTDGQIAAAVWVVVLALYVRTLYPTVPGGDSGELIAVAYNLGVIHPPGYPLYTLLAKLFTYVPHGSIAWRVNLFSAVCDASAAAVLFLAVRRWSGSRAGGVLAAGLFAFSPLVWTYATVAEVFSLNNLFVALLLYLAVRYSETRELRVALVGAFTMGLGLSNHHTLVFLVAPLTLWILWIGRRQLLTSRRMAQLTGCFALGLLPYLYLPIASASYPPISWGHAHSWEGFVIHFLRKEYGTLQLGETSIGVGGQLGPGLLYYSRSVLRETLFGGVALALLGVVVQWRREKWMGVTLMTVVAFLFYIVVFHALANLPLTEALTREVTARFWQQPNIIVCAWAGLGAAAIGAQLKGKLRLVVPVAVGAVCVTQVAVNFGEQDQSDTRINYYFAHSILDGLPERAILLSSGDIYTNAVRYLHYVERVRPDVRVLDRGVLSQYWVQDYLAHTMPDVVMPGLFYRPNQPNGFTLQQFVAANRRGGREIFLSSFQGSEDRSWEQTYATWPWGFVNWVVPKGQEINIPAYLKRTDSLTAPFKNVGNREFAPGTWEQVVSNDFRESDHRRARRILLDATAHQNNPATIRLAIGLLEGAMRNHPAPTNEMYRNLGIMYSLLMPVDTAAAKGMVQAWRIYVRFPTAEDKDLPAIKATLAKFEGKYQ